MSYVSGEFGSVSLYHATTNNSISFTLRRNVAASLRAVSIDNVEGLLSVEFDASSSAVWRGVTNSTNLSVALNAADAVVGGAGTLPRVLSPPATHVGRASNVSFVVARPYCAAPSDPARVAGAGCSPGKLIDGAVTLDERMQLDWRIACDARTVQLVVKVASAVTGWFGVGFGLNANMVRNDKL